MDEKKKHITSGFDTSWKFNVSTKKDRKAQFLFFHIPKTAGTTFRYVLYNHFEDADLYPSQAELIANGGGYVNRSQFIQEKNYLNKTMLIGHFRVNILPQLMHKDLKKMAFFRNPLDRILSTIKHIRVHDKELKGQDVNLILKEKWNQIVFGQSMAMGYNPKDKNLDVVRENIIALDFIGITEYFEESLQLCNATFDWHLENITKQNVIKEEVFSLLSPKSKMRIVASLGPELNTYNIALNHFKRRCNRRSIELLE